MFVTLAGDKNGVLEKHGKTRIKMVRLETRTQKPLFLLGDLQFLITRTKGPHTQLTKRDLMTAN